MNIVIHIVGAIVVAVALRQHNMRSHNIISIGNLFSAVWGSNIIATEIGLAGGLRLSPFALSVVYFSWVAFLLGCLWVPASRPRLSAPDTMGISLARSVVLVLVLCGLQLVAVAEEVSLLGWNPALGYDEFSSYRVRGDSVSAMSVGAFRTWRWASVVYVPFAIFLFRVGTLKTAYLVVILAVAALATIPSFTRAPILQFLLAAGCCWVVWWRPSKRVQLILLSLAAGGFLFVAVGMQILLDQFSPGYNVYRTEIWGYIGGPMLAYQTILDGTFLREEGVYVLDGINFVLFKLGAISSYPSLIRPVAPALVETNVYTFLDAFTLDFGVLGAVFGSFLMANLFSRFQVWGESSGQPAVMVIYGIFMHWTAMSGLNNEVVRVTIFLFGTWACLAWVLTRSSPKVSRR